MQDVREKEATLMAKGATGNASIDAIFDVPERRGSVNKREAAALVTRLKFAQSSSNYLFRGVSRTTDDLVPSISRTRYDDRPYSLLAEKVVLSLVKNEGLAFRISETLSDIDLLALAQHFGAPTRLLDWTKNPLVALYFATFSGKFVDDQHDGIVYVYKAETDDFIRTKVELNTSDNQAPMFPQDLFNSKVRFISPRFVDARIRNQKGLFSVQENAEVSFVANCRREHIWKLIVPRDVKVTLARYLHGIGITHDFIMPDFAGFCLALGYRFHYNVAIRSSALDAAEAESLDDD